MLHIRDLNAETDCGPTEDSSWRQRRPRRVSRRTAPSKTTATSGTTRLPGDRVGEGHRPIKRMPEPGGITLRVPPLARGMRPRHAPGRRQRRAGFQGSPRRHTRPLTVCGAPQILADVRAAGGRVSPQDGGSLAKQSKPGRDQPAHVRSGHHGGRPLRAATEGPVRTLIGHRSPGSGIDTGSTARCADRRYQTSTRDGWSRRVIGWAINEHIPAAASVRRSTCRS
jgi:hypothetical protein